MTAPSNNVGPFGQPLGDPLAGATTCPHCNGVAAVSPHPRLNQVCNICGAPRIDMKDTPKLSGKELPHLQAARVAERKRLQWKAGGIFGGVAGGFVFALWTLWALIFGAGAVWAISGFAFAAPFIALVLAGIAKSKTQSVQVDAALRRAWKSAALEIILANPKGITAAKLAEALPMSVQQAEQIAAELSVDNQVSSRVTADGQLVLVGVAGTHTGQRIDVPPQAAQDEAFADPLEERFAELEQAEQEKAKQAQQQR